eukprot:CAMPEP_0115321724 /NCGR_PEP_ID=MMETSP0270-20121206/81021_1 /TAXON_ID=71861 /ORGANISM="Scrippsiella trochoidea, Strain CCMP3099" /LENGTH=32 /DNA_ID= /DNA_START= /DNA_END= /DNA_ORIENTATION=
MVQKLVVAMMDAYPSLRATNYGTWLQYLQKET